MTGVLDAIYLSPHLDDAALSCGGQIAERVRSGQRIGVVTVFSGDEPPQAPSELVRRLHADFGLAGGVVAARRTEDEAAMLQLGCESDRWNETEGIYRVDAQTGAALYPSLPALFGGVSPADSALIGKLGMRLRGLPPARRVAVPLGVGGQADHIIVRRAAESCFDIATLVYYEDYPYIERPMALWRLLRLRRGWRKQVEAFGTDALDVKLAAIRCYRSQVKPLFGDDTRLRRRVVSHCRRRGGERLWIRKDGVAAGWKPGDDTK